MEIKNRIETLMELKAELEERAQAVQDEILQTVEFADSEELTQEFIDWYYWDSGLSTKPLATALNAKNLLRLVTLQAELKLPCIVCDKSELIFNVDSRSKRIDKIHKHKTTRKDSEKRSQYWPFNPLTSEFVCLECKKHIKEEQKQKKIKNNITAAKIRVTKTGQGLDLENMPYQDYLQTDYWKRFAHTARKHAGYCCQQCGRNDTYLDVHHLTYERRGKEWYSDVLVLCRRCHAAIHGKAVR